MVLHIDGRQEEFFVLPVAVSLSLVIPTYNRGPRLRATLLSVTAARTDETGPIDILVVDDGSNPPAASALEGLNLPPRFSLKVLRQKNGGPAKARNAGFRATRGEIVLFIDDDILASGDLLAAHVRAHRLHPGSVICGRCPQVPPSPPDAFYRLLTRLGYDPNADSDEDFVPIPIVASGQLSVERRTFADGDAVYRDDLETPAAEEFELSWRVRSRGVPVFLGSNIVADHDTSSTISGVCRQQYKHGLGCAEVARRCPETLELPELEAVIRGADPMAAAGLKARLASLSRELLLRRRPRAFVLAVAESLAAMAPQADSFSPVYRLAVGLHFLAGVRGGLRRYDGAR